MFWHIKNLTALTSVIFFLLLTSGLTFQSDNSLASKQTEVQSKFTRIGKTKEYKQLDISREQFLENAIAMEEELFYWRNGSYIPCDEEHIDRVMKHINARFEEKSFVRDILEDYEKDEERLHNRYYEFHYLEF